MSDGKENGRFQCQGRFVFKEFLICGFLKKQKSINKVLFFFCSWTIFRVDNITF